LAKEGCEAIFHDAALTPDTMKKLWEIAILCMLKCPKEITWPTASGLVVAGFGTREFFPALRSFAIQGIFSGHLHYRPEREIGIGIEQTKNSFMVPFAQREMVDVFMSGVNPQYQAQIERGIHRVLDKFPEMVIDKSVLSPADKVKLKEVFKKASPIMADEFCKGLLEYRNQAFSLPIVELIAMLPKTELAVIAESMVSLTSLRRKVSMEQETVGGPIDVALITKGDGLIWIKRKHYFDPALNHQYFVNNFDLSREQ
jgi:hypothetical protein